MGVREAIFIELMSMRGLLRPHDRVTLDRSAEDEGESDALRTFADSLVVEGRADRDDVDTMLAEAERMARLSAPALPAGRRIGDFVIVRELGRGGMSVVFEAEQVSLERRVALKILPGVAALDERRLVRFVREAHAVGRMHHPGIVPIYTWGNSDGTPFFAMELVEGRSLAQEIDVGPLDPQRAARIAAEVAEALAYAHGEGVVHRDVKPGNVLLDRDDRARLTDFGVAHDSSQDRLTLTSAVLGTPAFIAPEQARGEPARASNDVYGVGAVLYAMLAGRPPYSGDPAHVLLAVLDRGPDPLSDVRRDVPKPLVAIVERAMSIEESERYQSAGELADDLRRHLDGLAPRAARATKRAPRGSAVGPWAKMGAAAVVLALVAALATLGLRWIADDGAGMADGAPRFGAATRITHFPGRETTPCLSPDGSVVAFSSGADGDWDVYVQRLDEERPVNLTDDHEGFDGLPAFAPDGRRLALVRQSEDREYQITVLDLETRETKRLTNFGGNPSWSPDGRRIVFTDSPTWGPTGSGEREIWTVDVETRGLEKTPFRGTHPRISPDGTHLAYWRRENGDADVFVRALDGAGPEIRVSGEGGHDWDPVWAPQGRGIYFVRDRRSLASNLFFVALDETTYEPLGEPRPVTNEIGTAAYGPAVSSDGEHLVFTRWDHEERMVKVGLDLESRTVPRPSEPLLVDLADGSHPAPSPEGDAIIYSRERNTFDLVLFEVDEGASRTLLEGLPVRPFGRFSPNGERIALHAARGDGGSIWVVDRDGSNLRRVTPADLDESCKRPIWSPDGRTIAFSMPGVGGRLARERSDASFAIEHLPPFDDPPGVFSPSSWSSDGTRLAGDADGVVVLDLDAGRYRRLTRFGGWPQWLPGEEEVLFQWQGGLWIVPVAGGEPVEIYHERPEKFGPYFALSNDGRTVYATRVSMRGDIWMLEDLDP